MIRTTKHDDLNRIAEIEVFNYRLKFYPIFQDDEFYFGELQVPNVARRYSDSLEDIRVWDDGVVKGFILVCSGEVKKFFVEPVLQGQGIGARLLEYAVEIRLRSAPDMPLENSRQGQALLQQAWRHGFVRTNPQSRPFRFRYVGKAHATAMTYLDVNFGEYLNWMHQKGSLAVSTEGELRYLILCQPVTDDHASFSLPVDARCEVSLDNTGYALAACTW